MLIPDSEASQLIRRARTGSDSALGQLLGGYREYLLRIAGERIDSGVRPKMAASDVVQGSLLVAIREFQQFRGNTEREFRTWLVRILTSRLVDGLRRFTQTEKRRTDRELVHVDSILNRTAASEETPSQKMSLQEDATKLLAVIDTLPPDQRRVVHGRYLDGLTFAQIGDRLSIPVTTCRRHWLDAIQTISRIMKIEP